MDPKFQTTFIPRKSVVDIALPKRAPIGIITLVSIALFVVAVGASGGLYFYKTILEKNQTELRTQLDVYRDKVKSGPVLDILTLNTRLTVATERLKNHFAASAILDLLSANTVQDVRWTSFNFQIDNVGIVTLTMNGQARSFATIAVQSDMFDKEDNFRNPLFSDITLDSNGNPMFNFKTEINPKLIAYTPTL